MAQPPNRPPDPDDETVIREGGDEWPPADDVYVEESEEVQPPRRPPTIWPWLLALLVLVLGGLGALWYFNQDDDDDAAATTATATTARTVRVPDVVGTTSSEATATLRTEGLEANVVSVPSDAPAGQVIAQDPAAGDEVEEGTTVRLNVARPSADTTPAATGPATTPTEPPATTTEPPATTTEPAATTTEPPATTAAPEPAVVPSVVGQELADAAETFADEGLKVAVRYVPSREAGGQVVAQAQPPGTELREGDTVQLNVSTGAEPAESAAVPRAVGQRLDQGRETLERAGFEVLALTVGDDEIRNESTIVSQSPGSGASIPRGALVLVYV